LVPDDGLIVAGGKDAHLIKALAGISAPVELCALEDGFSWSARTTGIENGCYRGEVQYKGQRVASLKLSVAGEHNLINATMAVAACHACGIEPAKAADAIGGFTGVDRRMTEVGRVNGGAIVIDDYGHHPTEIRATLKAVRERYKPQRLLCVFQPHQHSRTRFLLEDFATSFAQADETIVPDIYFVRDSESEKQRVSAQDLVARINESGQRARHLSEFSAIVEYLKEEVGDGDVVLTMGAGNVWEIGRDLVG
jgi:UDP-N-acetylmuramate--alanine ligase